MNSVWLIDWFIHHSLICWLMDSFRSYAKHPEHRINSSFKKDIRSFGLIDWLIHSSFIDLLIDGFCLIDWFIHSSFIDLLIDGFIPKLLQNIESIYSLRKFFDFWFDCLIVGLIDWLCWLTLYKRFIMTNLILFNIFCLGHESKAMLNNGGPRYKRSKLERQINSEVLYCVFILFGLCLIGAVG